MSDEQELGDFNSSLGETDDDADEQVERKAQNAVGTSDAGVQGDETDDGEAVEIQKETLGEITATLDVQGVEEVQETIEKLRPVDEQNPIDLDPRVGRKDLCFDRAKPGAKVYVVDVLAESVPEYYEEFPDAPALDDYAGNVVTRFRDADAVFACVYVKDSLTSVDTNITAYPMPESRLTRFPAEQATMVGQSEAEFERTDLPEDT